MVSVMDGGVGGGPWRRLPPFAVGVGGEDDCSGAAFVGRSRGYSASTVIILSPIVHVQYSN